MRYIHPETYVSRDASFDSLYTAMFYPQSIGSPKMLRNHLAIRTSYNGYLSFLSICCCFVSLLRQHVIYFRSWIAKIKYGHGLLFHLFVLLDILFHWSIVLYMHGCVPNPHHTCEGLWSWYGISNGCIIYLMTVPYIYCFVDIATCYMLLPLQVGCSK